MLLSGVIEQATGKRAGDYARRKLFDRLGIEQAEWWRDARANAHLLLPRHDDPRIRALRPALRAPGHVGHEQVVPRAWVEASLTPAPRSDDGYGYQWWLDKDDRLPDDTFVARGHDGQYIYVIPSLDLVVVRNGHYDKDPGPPIADPNLFEKYPSDGLVPGKGTINPERNWDDADLLRPIVQSLTET